jgi:hypothetical protein
LKLSKKIRILPLRFTTNMQITAGI